MTEPLALMNDSSHVVRNRQKFDHDFWALRLRRQAAAIDPRAIDLLGYFGLIAIALWTCLYGLGSYGILNGNESLYVESAREMAQSKEWAVPTLNGLPYLEKPPLFVWLVAAAASLGGSVELPPRLVTAVAALCLILGIVRSSVVLKIGQRGFTAGFILATSLGIDVMSRVAMPDLTLAALFSFGCFNYLAALQTRSVSRVRLAAGLLGAASLIKGALALMLFGLIAIAYYALEPARRDDMRKSARDPAAVLLFFLPLCLWLIAIEAALPGAAAHVIVEEHILRFLGMREPHDYYSGSPLYYVPRLFLFFFPWAGVLLFGWLAAARQAADARQTRRFLWLCVWIPFGFFTLSSAKANYYILLCIPAMALLTADYLPGLLRERRRFPLVMAVVAPILLFVAIWAYRLWQIRSGRAAAVTLMPDGSGPQAIALLAMLSLAVVALILAGWRRPAMLCLGGLLMPVSLQFDHLVARAEPFMSARTIAAYIQDRDRNVPVYIFEDFEALGALPIYLKQTIPVIDSKSNDLAFGRRIRPHHPNFVTADKVLASGNEAVVVVMQDRLKDYAGTALPKVSTELTTIGRAKLFRIKP
ncbi:MAG: glycosyltransferase family 39 protein [Rhodocyclaceae bacterium]|nr:glycosyltransferase family 39 protein [Rhodocyclaceae bacterium]